jgi:hypothetical protein
MRKKDFLVAFLGSEVRVKVLRLFCSSPHTAFTEPEISARTVVPHGALSHELSFFVKLGLIKKATCVREVKQKGKETTKSVRVPGFIAHVEHEHFASLSSFVRETTPQAEDAVAEKLKDVGSVKLIIVSGFFVAEEPNPSGIDMLIIGEKLNERKVATALRALEAEQGREVAYAVFTPDEFKYRLDVFDRLVRDVLDYPHRVVLDKLRFF